MRLVLLFLLLALATTGIFLAGMQRALSGGWSAVLRPLVADYVDRLAADIGSPPDLARAQALVQRLPLSVRIDGPPVQCDSHPQRRAWHRAPDRDDDDDGRWLLQRQHGRRPPHRLRPGRPRLGARGRAPSAGSRWPALLLLTAAAYAYVRRLFRPLDDIRAGALRFGQGAVRPADPGAPCATNWATWPSRSTPWPTTSAPCSKPSAACCWRSATNCARR